MAERTENYIDYIDGIVRLCQFGYYCANRATPSYALAMMPPEGPPELNTSAHTYKCLNCL